jgi:uncharacterized protein YpbB
MAVTYLETVILYCLERINGERSVYSVFHLLKGKKSSQTIQDAHLYQLAKLFQSFLFLNREDFDHRLAWCKNRNWITTMSGQNAVLTDEGKTALSNQIKERPLPKYLNGWRHHSLSTHFWERLSLLVQVSSNLAHYRKEYMPVQRKAETQHWLKKFLMRVSKDRDQLAGQLYEELTRCLTHDPLIRPDFFVIRLTGHDRIGLTSRQAAKFFNEDLMYYHLQFLNVLHFLIDSIYEKQSDYPLLNSMIADIKKPHAFTLSTTKTYEWLKKGYSIDEIAAARNLKKSTIEDHIVEIALLDPMFDINQFVSPEKQKKILAAAKKADSNKLKQIREWTNGIDYFDIRLVMAKFGDSKWN